MLLYRTCFYQGAIRDRRHWAVLVETLPTALFVDSTSVMLYDVLDMCR